MPAARDRFFPRVIASIPVSETAPANTPEPARYDSEDITVLEGLEAVRHRPGMYIGSTGPRGLHHLVYELVDNSVDEAMAGRCSAIWVDLFPDGSCMVRDDGAGIPVAPMADQGGRSALEVVLTVLHAGGKFGGEGYKVSGGLHGVGVSVVNALSEWLVADVCRDGFLWRQRYARGTPLGPIEQLEPAEGSGTTITFLPDADIMEDPVFDFDTLQQRFRETAFLTRGLSVTLRDQRAEPREVAFQYDGGISDFVRHLNESRDALHPDVISLEVDGDEGLVEVALQWTGGYTESVHTFANNINTHEGGTHLSGFRTALTLVVNDTARGLGVLREKDDNFEGQDVREGLTAIISVKLRDPQFEGQTKTKLGNSAIAGFVQKAVTQALGQFFEEHPAEAKTIAMKGASAQQARLAARSARDMARRKSAMDSSTLPGKLNDCSDKDPANTELFLVEGDSAGGSAVRARQSAFQAILPLRGKILNVEKARLDRVLQNNEIEAMITAMGTGIGEEFDVAKARYHKLVIMTDADVDGAHIRTLILTFLFRHMRELIEAGFVYIACPPLYKVKQRTDERYIEKEHELDDWLLDRNLASITIDGRDVGLSRDEFQRYVRVLREHDGWANALRSLRGADLADFLITNGFLDIPSSDIDDAAAAIEGRSDGIRSLSVEIVDREARTVRIRSVQLHSGEARSITLPLDIMESRELVGLRGAIEKLGLAVGAPPFVVRRGARHRDVATIDGLKNAVMELASEGVLVQRFKGLGEMNADQLWETTMDPTRRILQQVTLEDAAAAEELFSLLMGDKVEPRRAFIEQNARSVRFLDV